MSLIRIAAALKKTIIQIRQTPIAKRKWPPNQHIWKLKMMYNTQTLPYLKKDKRLKQLSSFISSPIL